MTYPFICNDLIGSVLGGVDRWQTVVDFAVARVGYFGLEASARRRAASATSWSNVIKVQVLLVGLILLLQRFIEDIRVIPDLEDKCRPLWSKNAKSGMDAEYCIFPLIDINFKVFVSC